VDALREKISDQIRREREQRVDAELGNEAFEKIMERISFPLPDSVTKTLDEQHEEDDATAAEGTTEDREAAEKRRADAERSFRTRVVLERIAEANDLTVEDEEIDGYLQAVYGVRGRQLVELKQGLDTRGGLGDVHDHEPGLGSVSALQRLRLGERRDRRG